MSVEEWSVLLVDDDQTQVRQMAEFLSKTSYGGVGCRPIECSRFDDALGILRNRMIDVIILDIRLGAASAPAPTQEMGSQVYQLIRQHQFLPVIFYTALPPQAPPTNPPWISLVSKTAGLNGLKESLGKLMDSGLPFLRRKFDEHVRCISRDTLWAWADDQSPRPGEKPVDVAYYLMRKLGRSLDRENLGPFLREFEPQWDGAHAHPYEYYLWPPLTDLYSTGDIFRSKAGGIESYYVLVTPICDIEHNKVDRYAFVGTSSFLGCPELTAASGSKGRREELIKLVGNGLPRYIFLPEALTVPALIIDFQKIATVPRDEVEDGRIWTRIASLDKPFAQALTAKLVGYFGRIGTPDLDASHIVDVGVKAVQQGAMSSSQAAAAQE